MTVVAKASATMVAAVASTMTMTMTDHVNAVAAMTMAEVVSEAADTTKIGIGSTVADSTKMIADGNAFADPRRSLRLSSTKTSIFVATRMSVDRWNETT